MTKEYIEREALLHNMQHPKIEINDGQDFANWYSHCVRCAPAANAAPVVHGHVLDNGNPICGPCSACGESVNRKWHYCPNCGARMDGNKKEEEITK